MKLEQRVSKESEHSVIAKTLKSNHILLASKTFLAIAVLAGCIGLTRYFGEAIDLESFKAFVKQSGPLAPISYCLAYLIGPTIFFPASVLTMSGGAIFGPIWGTVYTIFAATLGATIPFLLTRRYGRKPIEKLIANNESFETRFRDFEQKVAQDGWKYVAFTRLVTVFPFLVLNYAFGLTRISVWTYMWSSFVFMLPGSFMFNYLGYAGREALSGGEQMATKISIAIGCLILISTLPRLVRSRINHRIQKQES